MNLTWIIYTKNTMSENSILCGRGCEFDRETTPDQGKDVFLRLANAAEKRMTVIGGGTHTLLLENQWAVLHDVVRSFLRGQGTCE